MVYDHYMTITWSLCYHGIIYNNYNFLPLYYNGNHYNSSDWFQTLGKNNYYLTP